MLSQRANRFKVKQTRFIGNAKWKSLVCAEPHRKQLLMLSESSGVHETIFRIFKLRSSTSCAHSWVVKDTDALDPTWKL
jgi:hypothetical protein